jgi:hypothetical protein
MNTSKKGKRAEVLTIKLLEAAGYYCTRSDKSRGLFDVWGFSSTDFVLVQVKCNDWPSLAEMEALTLCVVPPNTRKLVHRWRDGRDEPDVRVLD